MPELTRCDARGKTKPKAKEFEQPTTKKKEDADPSDVRESQPILERVVVWC